MIGLRDRLLGDSLPATLRDSLLDLQRWIDSAMERNTPPEPAPSSIFHYTSRRAAEAILASGRIWFTDCRFLNDQSEVLHGLHVADEPLTAHEATYGGPIGEFCRNLRTRLADAAVEKFSFYVASFCLDPDNEHLWKEYADNSRGVVLEFDPGTIDEPPSAARQWLLQSFPIRYDHDLLARMQREAVDFATSLLQRSLVGPLASATTSAYLKETSVQSALLILFNSLLFKHPKWGKEREFRALFLGERSRLHAHPYGELREIDDKPAPYIALPFTHSAEANRGIKRVWLGANVSPGQSEEMRQFLTANGYQNVEILPHKHGASLL